MNHLNISFEQSPWESELAGLMPGQILSASRFLAMLEGESEEAVEDAFAALEEQNILLDVSDLPPIYGDGESGIRLRREDDLAQKGFDVNALEETDPLRLYLEELAAIPAFGDEDLLAQELLAGRDVTEQLTNLMLSAVWQHALELTGRGVLLLDLVQEGSLGLLQALSCYRGGNIRMHCQQYIRLAMAKTVTLQARAAGVGQRMRQALEDYRAVDERLLGDLGRNATLEEIAEQLHMTPEQTQTVADMFAAARTMQTAKLPVEETPEDDQAVEDTSYFQARQRIEELLSGLDEREAQLLKLRFGLDGSKPLTPEQTGIKLNLTPEEVVAVEAAALAKLRKQ